MHLLRALCVKLMKTSCMYLLALILAFNSLFCTSEQQPAQKPDTTKVKRKMTITEVLEKYTDEWMKIPGVNGTGQGEHEGKPAVIVFVETKTATIEEKIPKTIEGFTVVIEEIGEVRPLK